ncbi:hypothetical protein T06_10837 [Trichinella sp. T6]|nr:hypothetical protein T06_10837 [Trichinella sp. T6]
MVVHSDRLKKYVTREDAAETRRRPFPLCYGTYPKEQQPNENVTGPGVETIDDSGSDEESVYSDEQSNALLPRGFLDSDEQVLKRFLNISLHSDSQVRPAILDITGDPKKTEAADLAQAS